ncbi:MAG TPA: efflux transporter outer membrane subunit [Candidatus Saccharimonadales bacterium]|nr:efflux transporter outer membrane subunit [Candidatus Saccharimonadales bacterium]
MKPNHLFSTALLALTLAAGGCAHIPSVGPDYQPPRVSGPSQWGESLAGGETNSNASVAGWWKNFHDAELDSLISRAAQSNLDLRIAESRVREARAEYGIAAGNLWPTIHADGSYARQRQSPNQPLLIPSVPVPLVDNDYQAGFDASWEIDVFGGQRRSVEAAKAEVAAAEFGQHDVLITLLGEVARNYLDARGYQRRLEITRENIQAQEQVLALTRNQFTNGLANNLDVQQAATLLATTRAQVPTLETALQMSIHRLGVLLGQPPEALQNELAASAPIPAAPPQIPVALPSELLLRRPDVAQAERQLAAATANIGVAKADLFPKFYLTGVAGFQGVSADDWFDAGSRFWSLGPAVQWNIFDAGRIRSNIKVQNARQQEALASYEKTTLTAFEDVENGLTAYAKEQVRRRSLEDAVKSSQESLRLSKQLYANGLSDFINVLDAERSLYQAQDDLVQSDTTISTDLISLYKSLGGGWEIEPLPISSAEPTSCGHTNQMASNAGNQQPMAGRNP